MNLPRLIHPIKSSINEKTARSFMRELRHFLHCHDLIGQIFKELKLDLPASAGGLFLAFTNQLCRFLVTTE